MAKLYFVDYYRGSELVDSTVGLRSKAQATSHGKKTAKAKGYSSFQVTSKPSGSTSMPTKIGPRVAVNPHTLLKSNRLTPVRFSIKGKTHTGKAKLVKGKVKVFVTANVARKINPELGRYKIIYALTRRAELTPSISSQYTRNYETEVTATTSSKAVRIASKKKKEVVPGKPANWHVMSVRKVS